MKSIAIFCISICLQMAAPVMAQTATDTLILPEEKHFKNMKQITFGGDNAEAYWSFDNKSLIFQSNWKKLTQQGCDQIFTVSIDGDLQYKLVSTDKGRTTCSYYLPDGRIIFASTHQADSQCPEVPAGGGRYVWPIYDSYDIFIANADGTNIQPLITGKGYDAEATVSPDGKYMIFTSTRSGDLELWRYEFATRQLLQITNTLGYDGGAFFSRDSKKIVWRASRPQGADTTAYKELLSKGLVEPSAMNIFIADIDGKNVQQVTNLPGANWAPFFHPSGKKIIFSSNHHSLMTKGRPVFSLFMINIDGTGLERISYSSVFDAFPMFSFDGKKIVFASNRNNNNTRDTNIFVADWID